MNGSLATEQRAARLEALSADRLRAVVDALKLDATDRRARSALIDALSKASLADLLAALRAAELRAFCETLGLYAKGTKGEAPALHGEPLRPGESLDITATDDVLAPFDSYLEITEDLAYGYEDLEGYGAGPPGFVDPDPPAAAPPTQAAARR